MTKWNHHLKTMSAAWVATLCSWCSLTVSRLHDHSAEAELLEMKQKATLWEQLQPQWEEVASWWDSKLAEQRSYTTDSCMLGAALIIFPDAKHPLRSETTDRETEGHVGFKATANVVVKTAPTRQDINKARTRPGKKNKQAEKNDQYLPNSSLL